jgi:hypothetical protein
MISSGGGRKESEPATERTRLLSQQFGNLSDVSTHFVTGLLTSYAAAVWPPSLSQLDKTCDFCLPSCYPVPLLGTGPPLVLLMYH